MCIGRPGCSIMLQAVPSCGANTVFAFHKKSKVGAVYIQIGAFMRSQHAIDQRRREPNVRPGLAERQQPHVASYARTQVRSSSRLQSCPAVRLPFIFSASGCSDRRFEATVPSSRTANAWTSDGSSRSNA